jgi:glyoxylase-like metal-dependent hydrolase (beta-lactamase superfamily II)
MANNATARSNGKGGTDVSFTIGGKYTMTGTINAQGEVERVQTAIDHPVVGDMPVVTTYTGYRDFGGIVFPSRIVQTQDGFPSLDLTIWTATANPTFDAPVPDNVRTAPPPAPQNVASAKIANGVYHLTGGGAHSVAIEMRDHIVLVDTPTSEARAMAVIAKAKELIPNKPVRFVITSHHHWDHLSGIRAAIDEGATIVTHESNRVLLERVAKTQHTIVPDRLATSKKSLKIQTVGDRGQLTDGTRTIELYREPLNTHTGDMLLVWLPADKVLTEVDIYGPPAQMGQPLVRSAVPFAKALLDTLQQLKIEPTIVLPLHGNRTTTVAEIARGAGIGTATN